MKSLFSRIIDRELPAQVVYEDERCIAIHDIHPVARVHALLIPKKPIPRLSEAESGDQDLLGYLLLVATKVAAQLGIADTGFRMIINNGKDAGESVPHLHLHLLGGEPLGWKHGGSN
ncbi:histidine triad nucleotide-binding protein [Methylacidimicrobium sp. B4]|uniref:histidine triad nucleotide-binding protein n=1 Tax=Methylacidimicrobium sp. B4 TaxID=2796139 RepID=UPI001A8CD9E7|nr:histidine triad nucleotide-binding protein [Methylacidimicrobium sp. B4]QSR85057.1 histidine triad nucleotide-binding protein [Methylacidimicrobium sp. B4]